MKLPTTEQDRFCLFCTAVRMGDSPFCELCARLFSLLGPKKGRRGAGLL